MSGSQIVKSSASECCLAFAWFFANFSLVLLMKELLIKKACILYSDGTYFFPCDVLYHVYLNLLLERCVFKCNKLLQFVCASDGKTYSNECIMREKACERNINLTVAKKKPC